MSEYREDLLGDLSDPEYAALYLTAAYRESRGTFLLALRDVADAIFGMTKLAASVEANRVSLYRTLSQDGNPTLSTLNSILESLSLDVSFSPRVAVAPTGASKKRQPALPNTSGSNSKEAAKTSHRTGTGAAGTSKRPLKSRA